MSDINDAANDEDRKPNAGAASTGGLSALAAGQFSGPYQILYQQMQAKADAQRSAQQQMLDTLQQQQGALGQTGMSDYDKASMLFQAAGALGQTTRSGGFGETIGNLGTAMAGPLSKAAEAQRQRQTQLQQLQMARQKLGVEMAGSGGVDPSQALTLLQAQQKREDDETETFEPKPIGQGKYALFGDAGTSKPIPAELYGSQAAAIAPDITGDEFIKTLPPAKASVVRSLMSGETAFPSAGSMAYKRLVEDGTVDALAQATQGDPNAFSSIKSGARKDMTLKMQSDKPNTIGYNLRATAAMLGHLGEWVDKSSELENYDTPAINSVKNAAANISGSPETKNWMTANNTYQGEAGKAIKGGVPGVYETQERMALADVNDSPDQLQGHADTTKRLLIEKIQPMMDNYNKTMGTNYTDVRSFLKDFAPSSVAAYDKLENTAIKGSTKYKKMQADAERARAAQPAQAQSASAAPAGQSQVTAQPADTARAAAVRAAMEELARRNAQAGAQ